MELGLEPADVRLNLLADTPGSSPSTEFFGSYHLDHLTSPLNELDQFHLCCIGQWPRLGLHHGGKVGQDPSIQTIGLGQDARGAAEMTYLTWVDDCHRHTASSQCRGHGDLVAAAGFEHHQRGSYLDELASEAS
jgi:hypothetical protein